MQHLKSIKLRLSNSTQPLQLNNAYHRLIQKHEYHSTLKNLNTASVCEVYKN